MPPRQLVQRFVDHVHGGRSVAAIEEFYADDVIMQVNTTPPVVGRAANAERQRAFVSSTTLHKNRARAVLLDGDHAVISWLQEFTGSDGTRYCIDELSFQTWRGDKIIHERFYYDSATIAADGIARLH